MFQNLCLSLLALVTYLRREIMEDHGIHRNTIDLFWNLQDFELGRVRMVKLMLLVVHKCFICPNVSYVQIELSCVDADSSCVWGSRCSSGILVTGVPISATSRRIWVPCLPHLIRFVFALLHFEHVSSNSSESLCCMIWLLQFGVLVCFDTRTKTIVFGSFERWIWLPSEKCPKVIYSIFVQKGTFVNIHLPLFDQTSNVS